MIVPPTVSATAEVGTSERVSAVYSLTRTVPVTMLDADWLSSRDRDVFVWEQPSANVRIIGLGASVVHFGQGPDRFAEMGAAIA